MLRRLLVSALVLVLLAPTAAAFASDREELYLAYATGATPVVVASGALTLEGSVADGLFVGGSTGTTLTSIPRLTVVERNETNGSSQEYLAATLELNEGALLWVFAGKTVAIEVAAPYAIGLALPQAPLPTDGTQQHAGFLVAGEAIEGSLDWAQGEVELLPLDAIVTIRDSSGRPIGEWDSRGVNRGMTRLDQTDQLDIIFRADGDFGARVRALTLGGAAGANAALSLGVLRADEDRFDQTVALINREASSFSENGDGLGGDGGPLAMLRQISGILNGALLVIPGGGDGTTAEAAPLESRWGEGTFDLGPLNLLRGDDLKVAWAEDEMRVEGEPTVALGRDGFAVDEPKTLGLFPIVSVFLWACALAAIVWYFVRKPPTGRPQMPLRLLSFGFYLLVLAGTFFLWDKSFNESFGLSVLSAIREDGISSATLPRIGVLAALEFAPWGIAALLFALPVRIVLGVALRYLGRGKSFKGIASAGGLVALAILGPIYALWCFNLVWQRAAAAMGG